MLFHSGAFMFAKLGEENVGADHVPLPHPAYLIL